MFIFAASKEGEKINMGKYPRCPDGGPHKCKQRAWCKQCTPKGKNWYKTGTPGTPPLEFPTKGSPVDAPGDASE